MEGILTYLVRVVVTTNITNAPLPHSIENVWVRSDWKNDEQSLQRGTYIRLVDQQLTGGGPDIDAMADMTADLVDVVEKFFPRAAYVKSVHLVTAIAEWNT